MSFNSFQAIIFLLVALNYTLVVVSLVHLILRTRYTLVQRLVWMVVLWLVPVLGIVGYWVS
ncbi:phospholipase D-like protein [Pontibacter ummariensis]|uniref:Phospholipase_D-nuclease N-terminal n=1 Tax=Pontibacter ummariensis TaxID=1610492 RepID=A0A239H517_9BACT|nr:PLDc N-terminal domain-containing protein [Pontibacter ummariensis]PRY10878.1 phospholipase D-like protein [Pontibacter ummariensis]SNS76487.1 Phospholipase_D-nuclease N-terminal [Pontibacter ummariensis]